MNTKPVFLLAVLTAGNSCVHNKDGFTVVYNNDGGTTEYPIINGLREGTSIRHYNGGQIMIKEEWSRGKRNGKSVIFFENGHKKIESSYVDNIENGKYIEYYPNEDTLRAGNIADGLINGNFKEYYLGNKIKNLSNYSIVNGKSHLNGYKTYDEKGYRNQCLTWPTFTFNKQVFSLGDTVKLSVYLDCAPYKHTKGLLFVADSAGITIDSTKRNIEFTGDKNTVVLKTVAKVTGKKSMSGFASNYMHIGYINTKSGKGEIVREMKVFFKKNYFVK